MLFPVSRYAPILLILLGMLTWSLCSPVRAQGDEAPAQDTQLQDTISTLQSLISMQNQLKSDIQVLGRQLLQEPSALRHVFGDPVQGAAGRRPTLVQEGHHLTAQEIAIETGIGITRVIDPHQALFLSIVL